MASITRPHTFTSMTPLGQYYIRQAGSSGGGGGRVHSGIGHIYSVPPVIQRGHGIGSFLRGLWRNVRPVLWSSAKSVGREALRTGAKVMTDIAANPGQTGDILSKHASETTQYIITKLRGGGRKRKRASTLKPRKQKNKRTRITKRKVSKTIKRDIFS